MLPRLFRIPVLGLPVHAYGFMLMLGFVFATMVIVKRAKRDKFDGETLLDLSIYIMLSGIVGARIAYLIIFHHEFDWGIFNLGDGGMSFLGAVAGWIIPVAIFAYKGGFKPKEPRSWGSFIKVLGLLLFGCVAGSVVLGRIVYVFQHRQIYSLEVMEFWRGGLVYYGGVTAGFIVGALFLRYKKIPVWRIGDLVAAPAALGLAFGRMGCFLNGCCFGKIAQNFPLAMRYPHIEEPARSSCEPATSGSPAFMLHEKMHLVPADAVRSLPVHPAQLYEVALDIALFFILSWMWKKNKYSNGVILGMLGVGYSIIRFFMEFFRGDEKPYFAGLTVYQVLSMLLLVASVIFIKTRRSDTPPAPVLPAGKAV
jgi:phosphatidylglycerol:prolipoprotein diacylglycerol transferase